MTPKAIFVMSLILFFTLFSCKQQEQTPGIPKSSEGEETQPLFQQDTQFTDYVSEYTFGTVSARSTITFKLAEEVDLSNPAISTNNLVAKEIYTITPKLAHQARWEDNRTFVIYPDKGLEHGKNYSIKILLTTFYPEIPENLKEFTFNIIVKNQNFSVNTDEVIFTEEAGVKKQNVTGILETADWMENENVKKLLKGELPGEPTPEITWEHQFEENKHRFTLSGLQRKEKDYFLTLKWDGAPVGVKEKGEKKITIYSKEEFMYLSYQLIQSPEKLLKIQFSMPLDEKQDLRGIVPVKGDPAPRFLIENNQLRYYPSNRAEGVVDLVVGKEIKDSTGTPLGKAVSITATFKQVPPQIKWVLKEGGIIPGGDKVILPFESITLKAVDITIIEVYEKNMIQFLQVNKALKNSSELRRVGRPVATKTISLEGRGVNNLYIWNRFNLDLSEFVRMKPGSLYQVRMNFRRSQSIYSCTGDDEFLNDEPEQDDWEAPEEQVESSYWDYYYYDDYWEDRNNPCTSSYYGSRRQIAMNFLASNLGIITKGNEAGEMNVYITDIRTTEPLEGVNVDLYNYQQILIGSAKSDQSGKAYFKATGEGTPFAVVAQKGNERGYARIDKGSALDITNFNVGGSSSAKGIKGFIYGERGVWRPGDRVHLNFILEDKQKILPEGHPVIFELQDPRGQIFKRIVKKEHVNGIYNFNFDTHAEVPTGDWLARIRVGGEVFSKILKIETVKPNRLKINLDFGTERLTVEDKTTSAKLDVRWLHGAVASGLRAEFDMNLFPGKTRFDNYGSYEFDDPSRSFYSETQNIFSGTLDSEGKAEMTFPIRTNANAPGALRAVFYGKVFEEGGDFSIDSFSMPYYPYESFVGLKLPPGDAARGMLLTDTDHKVDIATVDSYGNPLSGKNLKVEVYQLNWKWWWDQTGDSSYIGRSSSNRVAQGTVSTVNGKGEWTLRINYPAWGRYFIRIEDPVSGHSTGKIFYIDWPGWAGAPRSSSMGGASLLTFYTDKKSYNVGEEVTVIIPSTPKGRALVSLETGNRMVDSFWAETKEGMKEIKFKATAQMAPNVYIHITQLQPHGQQNNDLPLRLYGVFPVGVVDPATKLNPEIKVADTLAPKKEVVIKVSEKNKMDMAYTLAIVDEGLLDLTRFITPDPWYTFYAKEALGIRSWDIFEQILAPINGQTGPLLSIGGDGFDDIRDRDNKNANRFKPVVMAYGPFFLKGGSEKTHTFTMPRYIGAVKTMVVAANNGSYGSAEKSSLVKESLMVLGTMPRVLGPGEKIKLPVNVFVLDEKIKEVKVTVKAEGVLRLSGEESQTISFQTTGDKYANFDLETLEKTGIGKILIQAVSGNEKALYDLEINVRASNPPVTSLQFKSLSPGETWEGEALQLGIEGTNTHTIEISSLPPVDLSKRLSFLIQYPHGCIEQTTSSVFPQLHLDDITELNEKQKQEIPGNINAGIERLKKFITPSGGFAYWPGESTPSEWGTNYGGHFLLEARNKGYYIPGTLLSGWAGYQKTTANRWKNNTDNQSQLIQAYRLYTLALYGEPNLAAMNLMRELSDLELQARWRLAAAYALAGKESVAANLITELPENYPDYAATSATYGSPSRDRAMILETLALLKKWDWGMTTFKQIADELSSDQWLSTQSTAYALIAVSRFCKASQTQGTEMAADWQFGGEKGSVKGSTLFWLREFKTSQGNFTVQNTGKTPLYARFMSRGIPLKGAEKTENNLINMAVTYKTKEGTTITDLSDVKQGTSIIITTQITNPGITGDLEEMALTHILPSGWEIMNARLFEMDEYTGYNIPEYQDIRDDRVLTYFDLKKGESKTFSYMITAAYMGEYYLPGILCEAMYNSDIHAIRKGQSTKVSR